MFLVDFRQDDSALLYPGKNLLLDQLLEFHFVVSNYLVQLLVFFCSAFAALSNVLVECLVNCEH